MPEMPPSLVGQSIVDRDKTQLKLLSIFHFIFAGLSVLGILFLVAHFFLMHAVFDNPKMWQNQQQPPFDPQAVFRILKWFYLFGGTLCIAGGVVNLLSGLFIRARKHRVFSMVVAGVNCIQFPFGTALGIWTLVVLFRESVKEAYSEPVNFTQSTPPPGPR